MIAQATQPFSPVRGSEGTQCIALQWEQMGANGSQWVPMGATHNPRIPKSNYHSITNEPIEITVKWRRNEYELREEQGDTNVHISIKTRLSAISQGFGFSIEIQNV